MLKLEVPDSEFFDNDTQCFVNIKGQTLALEHSLVSLSKWESKWHIPFLSKDPKHEKTREMTLDYVRCMTITQNVNPLIYQALTEDDIAKIKDYIEDPMTATWFSDNDKGKPSNEIITAEIVYYWMISLNIPIEFQKWHFNRLITLIRVCSIKNRPAKKMSQKEWAAKRRAAYAARRGKHR